MCLPKFTNPFLGHGQPVVPTVYAIQHLERYPLGMPYTDITAKLAPLFEKEPLCGTVLAIDRTGVGRPVVDMVKRAKLKAQLKPITITAGHSAHYDDNDGGWCVPKRDLVGSMQVLL